MGYLGCVVLSMYFGATAVGVRARDGVVLATDRRMSYGGFIVSRAIRKVYVFEDRVAIAFAGLYGDMGGLYRLLEAELKYYQATSGSRLSVRAIAKRLSTILYAYKPLPFYVEAILGGVEDETPILYALDPLGSVTEDAYIAAGSGATIALGVLEAEYNPEINVDKAEQLAIRAVKASIERDAMTGDGIDIATITRQGAKQKTITIKTTITTE